MSEWTPEGIAIGVSIVAALLALASAVYTRSQAKVSERTRALEHDASWRAFWRRINDDVLDETTLEYGYVFSLIIQNIGNGDAFDVEVDLDGVRQDSRGRNPDVKSGSRIGVGVVEGRRLEVRWNERDGKRRTWKAPVPPTRD